MFIEFCLLFAAYVGQETFLVQLPLIGIKFNTMVMYFDCLLGILQVLDFLRHAHENMKGSFWKNT